VPRPDSRDVVEHPATPPVALHRWDGDSEPPVAAPIDAYALRLVAGRALYGADAAVAATPALAAFVEEPTLGINARDRDRLGVADGTRVRATSARGAVEIPIRTDPRVAPGVAFIAANLTGPGAPDLIDSDAAVTDLRVENLS
jgi:anaerobic selenocysteine-containing dehydrogenase